MTADQNHINGDPIALQIDRAVGELRRGRAIELTSESAGFVFTAAENVSAPLLARIAAGAENPVQLAITAQRAEALGIDSAGGPVSIELAADCRIDEIRALSGVVSVTPPNISGRARAMTGATEKAITAALQLAKAGRLLPALIWSEQTRTDDHSLLSMPVAHIAPSTSFLKHRLKRISQAKVPLADAVNSEIAVFRDEHTLAEHIAIIVGEPRLDDVVPVRLHSACLTGDLLSSLRCDCGEQLRTAVARIAELGGGVLLYLDQEGRGIGLANKLRAYALQDKGLDTVDADQHLGFLADERSYLVAAVMLQELSISRVNLLTNNPQKIDALNEYGIEVVGRVPLIATTNAHNERYIRAKRERAGHLAEESNG